MKLSKVAADDGWMEAVSKLAWKLERPDISSPRVENQIPPWRGCISGVILNPRLITGFFFCLKYHSPIKQIQRERKKNAI